MQLTVIVPVFNEADLLPTLHSRLASVLAALGCDYEMIAVDDGSRDASLEVLQALHRKDPHLNVVSLTRNFGQQAAFSAGLRYASGDAVILMDSDLQDPPEVIPQLLAKWREGWQVVYAVRTKRKEHRLKRMAYSLYYRILATISDPPIPPDAGDFSLLSRRAVELINAMPERTRFLRGLRNWIGLPQTAVEYERAPRPSGRPKYTLARLLQLGFDGFTAFSHVPLRLASFAGGATVLFSGGGLVALFALHALSDFRAASETVLTLSIVFVGGVQLVAVGILGEYLGRIYDEVKQRPTYIVSQLFGAVAQRALPDASNPAH